MESIRWVFRCASWNPTQLQWLQALQIIQPEERTRVMKFVFKRDCKSAMAGRLLIRKAVNRALNLQNNKIKLARTKRQKPYLVDDSKQSAIQINGIDDEDLLPGSNKISFNISHQGEYAVVAAEKNYTVGIDVMRIDEPASGIVTFFERMSRQFTYSEWKYIKSVQIAQEQLSRFYRLWTLKESYVKATGTGISVDLQTLSFNIITTDLDVGLTTTDTTLIIDGKPLTNWRFEETKIDNNHWISVAINTSQGVDIRWPRPQSFQEMTFDMIIKEMCDLDEEVSMDYWHQYASKHDNPASRKAQIARETSDDEQS